MKNSKQQPNIHRDYDKVKKALLHPENGFDHIVPLHKFVNNFERKYGARSEYSLALNDLFWVLKKEVSRRNR